MHYEDKEVKNVSKLTVVVYKHQVYDDKFIKKNEFDYELTSIQKCQYVNPKFIVELYKFSRKFFSVILKDSKAEQWYSITFTNIGRNIKTYKISKPRNVSNSKNKFHILH